MAVLSFLQILNSEWATKQHQFYKLRSRKCQGELSHCNFKDCNEATLVTNGNGYMSGVAPYANPDNAEQLWEESLRYLSK
jgi:hypothetical protein